MSTPEPFATCRFYVQVDDKTEALFTEVSGLQVELAVHEQEEGGNNGFVHRLPGRAKVGNLTLKRGMTRSHGFLKWLMDIAAGQVVPRNVTVVMFDVERSATLRWNLIKAYPVKWSGPTFKSDGTETAVEFLELAHAGITLA